MAPFQTRIKLGDSVPIQWIPLKAVGARPPGMKDVKLGPEDATVKPEKKTFLQQYVSSHCFSSYPILTFANYSISPKVVHRRYHGYLHVSGSS